jgi:hypothetical protein
MIMKSHILGPLNRGQRWDDAAASWSAPVPWRCRERRGFQKLPATGALQDLAVSQRLWVLLDLHGP